MLRVCVFEYDAVAKVADEKVSMLFTHSVPHPPVKRQRERERESEGASAFRGVTFARH